MLEHRSFLVFSLGSLYPLCCQTQQGCLGQERTWASKILLFTSRITL